MHHPAESPCRNRLHRRWSQGQKKTESWAQPLRCPGRGLMACKGCTGIFLGCSPCSRDSVTLPEKPLITSLFDCFLTLKTHTHTEKHTYKVEYKHTHEVLFLKRNPFVIAQHNEDKSCAGVDLNHDYQSSPGPEDYDTRLEMLQEETSKQWLIRGASHTDLRAQASTLRFGETVWIS